MRNYKVTIYTIAAELGLAPSTVSRALKGSDRVRPETRQRIRDAAEALGYEADHVARSLTTGSTRTLGVLVSGLTNPFMPEFVAALSEACDRLGYSLLLGDTREAAGREERVFGMLSAHRVDGIVVCSPRVREEHLMTWHDRGIPMVLVNRMLSSDAIPAVTVDNAAGTRLLTNHLLASGCRQLLFLGGPRESQACLQRAEGVRQAVQQSGLDASVEYLFASDNAWSARQMVQSYLGGGHTVDGIIAFDDLMAAGALQGLHQRGYSVPQDVAVVGFDDVALASLVTPALTTVAQPLRDMAQMVLDLMMEAFAGGTPRTVRVQPTLVVRQTAPSELRAGYRRSLTQAGES